MGQAYLEAEKDDMKTRHAMQEQAKPCPNQARSLQRQNRGYRDPRPEASALGGGFMNDSPRMRQERARIHAIESSPRLVAQRKRNDHLFGAGAAPQNGAELPDVLKTGIESLSGIDMADVRVFTNSSRPAQLNAFAYAQDNQIHLGPGQEHHLPHEAWHIVQQKQGRVSATMQLRQGGTINDDPLLEQEADLMGAQAANQHAEQCDRGSLRQVASSRQEVTQGKWFRMSTLLDDNDEREVATIQENADDGNFVEAFKLIVDRYAELADDFHKIEAHFGREDIRAAVSNILSETFEDPFKAYTAAEVVEQLEADDIISDGMLTAEGQDVGMEEEICDLSAQFSNLNLTSLFYSDVDDYKEEHQVYLEGNDVFVASNPTPLKELLNAAVWETCPIPAATITQLNGLKNTAETALYRIAGNAKSKLIGARTKVNMNAFRNSLDAIAKVLSVLRSTATTAAPVPATDLGASINFGQNAPPIEGSRVVAAPLSIHSATSGSQPSDGRLMKSIRKLAGTQSKSYVQMHLLNDLVFGPGQLWNLTPGPKQSNVDMEINVEDPLKRAILGKGLVINFTATVRYAFDPVTATDKDIDQNPDKYRFQHIDFTAEQLSFDRIKNSWVRAAVQDVDVVKVNGSRVNWRYGSLTPLAPKPRIFDVATTVADLESVQIQTAAATRIVAFVKAKPAWRPTGANKQQQLADAVKQHDKQSKIPNISSWKANSVLWT